MNTVSNLKLDTNDIEIAITGDEFRFIKNKHPDLINQILVKSKSLSWAWLKCTLSDNDKFKFVFYIEFLLYQKWSILL